MTDTHSISVEFRKSIKVEEFSHNGELLREGAGVLQFEINFLLSFNCRCNNEPHHVSDIYSLPKI